MASAPRYQLVEGSRQQLTYKWVAIGLFVILLIMVAFAFNDTGRITIFDNDYTISTSRLTKAIAFMVAILGLQVVHDRRRLLVPADPLQHHTEPEYPEGIAVRRVDTLTQRRYRSIDVTSLRLQPGQPRVGGRRCRPHLDRALIL